MGVKRSDRISGIQSHTLNAICLWFEWSKINFYNLLHFPLYFRKFPLKKLWCQWEFFPCSQIKFETFVFFWTPPNVEPPDIYSESSQKANNITTYLERKIALCPRRGFVVTRFMLHMIILTDLQYIFFGFFVFNFFFVIFCKIHAGSIFLHI